MEKLDPGFKRLLRSHKIEDLRAHAGAIYGIWPDFRLAYLNPGWFRFAADNNGEPEISRRWDLGVSMLDALPPETQAFYKARYRDCLESGNTWSYEYECSSAQIFRLLAQIVYPLGAGEGLLIANSLRVEQAHDPKGRPVNPPLDSVYRDQEGLIHQCAGCRRVKNPLEPERWDWVPAWVDRIPVATTHTFCPSCFGHFFRLPKDR